MTTETSTASEQCWICQPFGSGPTCDECAGLSTIERESRLTDTLLAEILEEERQANPPSETTDFE